jgi:D-aspartate ligase
MQKKAVIISENGSDSNWLGTARSLGRMSVPVIRLTPKSWYNSKYCLSVITPNVAEKPAEFLDLLIRMGKKRKSKDVLFPASDRSLILVSRNKEKLKPYYAVIASDWDTTEIVVDKSKTFRIAKKLQIPSPETYSPTTINDVLQIAGEIGYPCLIKPIYSHSFYRKFRTKLFRATSKTDLIDGYKRASRQGENIVIQEEILGGDSQIYSFGAVFSMKSEPLAVFPGRKIRQFPPHIGAGSFTVSVWNQRLVELGIRLLKGIKFQGIAGVEFKKDVQSGDFKLLEVNGRSWSWNYLATFCGLNLPYMAYLDAIGEKQKPIDTYRCDFELGLKWLHLSADFLSMIMMRKSGEMGFSKWFESLIIGKKTFAFLSIRDPLPALSEIRRGLREFRNTVSFYL